MTSPINRLQSQAKPEDTQVNKFVDDYQALKAQAAQLLLQQQARQREERSS